MRKGFTRSPQDDSPAVHVKNYITPGGLERLKEEHQFLLNKDRPAVAVVVAISTPNSGCGRSMGGFPKVPFSETSVVHFALKHYPSQTSRYKT